MEFYEFKMKYKFAINIVTTCIVILCAFLFYMYIGMLTDRKEYVQNLEQENKELKWQLDQVDQMICIEEKETYE